MNNQNYHYDQIYPYLDILQEVKELILPTIVDMVNPGDVEATGLRKEDIAEIVYSHIMALGYNDENLNAAVNDLMPTRNPIFYPGPAHIEAVNMVQNFAMISEDYKHQLWAFKAFRKATQGLRPHREVIIEVKKHLLFF